MEAAALVMGVLGFCFGLISLLFSGAVFLQTFRFSGKGKEERSEEEERRSRAMDEGFDNLMRYSVNGHDGFGG